CRAGTWPRVRRAGSNLPPVNTMPDCLFCSIVAGTVPAHIVLADDLTAAFGAQGTFVAENNVVSQSVPHLHVHVVPRTKGDGLRGFFWPRTKYADDEEAAGYARKLREVLEST